MGRLNVDACNFEQWTAWADERLSVLRENHTDSCSALAGGALTSTQPRVPSVKIFMFQNDEVDLLADWLQYHAYLFGTANLHVVDNASQNVHICKLLALYQRCGLHIRSHHAAMSLKHRTMTDFMREYHNNTFLVPIDADEFIALAEFQHNHTIANYTYASDRIMKEFSKLPVDGRKYKFHESKFVVFDKEVCEASIDKGDFYDPHYRRVMHGGYAYHTKYKPFEYKTFYYSKGFLATDQGNHHGFVEHDERHYGNNPLVLENPEHFFAYSDLVLFHFATSSYYGTKKKVLRAAHSYNYTDATNCSLVHTGKHYCVPAKAFRANNKEAHMYYMADCVYPADDNLASVRIDSFTDWFKTHSLTTEQLLGEPVSFTI